MRLPRSLHTWTLAAVVLALLAAAGCVAPDRALVESDLAFRALLEHPKVDLRGRIAADPDLLEVERETTLTAIYLWADAVDAAAERLGVR